MAVTISAAWTFDTRPQNGKYSYVPKFQDYNSWTVQAASYGTQGGAEIHIDLHNAPFTDLLTQARRGKIVSTLRLNSVNPGRIRTAMRAAAYPGENPNTVPGPERVTEVFLYLLSAASAEVRDQYLEAQPTA